MGVVYAAYDFGLDRKISLKLVRGERNSRDRQERLLREAQAMARLSHPNVLAVHDVGTYEDQVFIAMEFVAGGTLKQWIRARQRTWREVVDVFLQAGRGLSAAHQAGLVHRDFKPENVLVGDDGRVRVTDFGLAVHAPRDEVPVLVLPVGGARFASGTAAYMAPEQRRGLPVDARADQYAFCVALNEALCGERPTGPAPTSGLVEAGVPRGLVRLLRRGLSAEPSQRFPTMEALLAELTRCRHPGRIRLAVAGGLGLAGALAAFWGVLAAQPQPDPASPARDVFAPIAIAIPPPPAPSALERCVEQPGAPIGPDVSIHAGSSASTQTRSRRPEVVQIGSQPARSTAGESPRPTHLAYVGIGENPPVGFGGADTYERNELAVLAEEFASEQDAWRLLDEFRREGLGSHRVAETLERFLRRRERPLGAAQPQISQSGQAPASGAIEPSAPFSGYTMVRPIGTNLPSIGLGPSPELSGPITPGDTRNYLERRTVATLERALLLHIQAQRSKTEIAEARFALAKALWETKANPDRAIELAQQAKEDLKEAEDPSELDTEVHSWLEEKLERRRRGSEAHGAD